MTRGDTIHPFEDLIVFPEAIGIHWFGRSSFALKSPRGSVVRVDPCFPGNRPAGCFVHARLPHDQSAVYPV